MAWTETPYLAAIAMSVSPGRTRYLKTVAVGCATGAVGLGATGMGVSVSVVENTGVFVDVG